MRRECSPRCFALASLMASLAVACGHGSASSSPDAGLRACIPGASLPCAGPGGCSGFQVCKTDGTALGACSCGAGHQPGGLDASIDSTPDGAAIDATVIADATVDGNAVADGPAEGSDEGGSGNADAPGMILPEAGVADGGCTGLACSITTSCQTTLSGHVYDPAGSNALYNVAVYVPDDPGGTLPPITPGTHTCQSCGQSIGRYLTVATTDLMGRFTLTDVPATTNVPVVVQVGKWRRQVILPKVTACSNNQVPDGTLRLPASKTEGDMPQMALLTGGCDDLGCFLRNVGVAATEFGAPHSGGRVDVYQGTSTVGAAPGLSSGTAGDCTSSASCPLWGSKGFIEYYDVALLSCECSGVTRPASALQVLHDWTSEGGKVLAFHFQYTWFQGGPSDFQGVATWLGTSTAGMGTYDFDTSFPKGQALSQWLQAGASIPLANVSSSVSSVNGPTRRWIYDPGNSDTKVLSFGTPIGGIPAPDGGSPQYCGKVTFSDVHSGTSLLASAANVPGDCKAAALTEQGRALEYLFFDLSSCVSDDRLPPPPLPPPPGF